MSDTKFEIEGLDDLMNRLQDMGKKAGTIANIALKAAAEPVLEDAKSLAPKNTGRLRDGLKITNIKTQAGVKYVLVGIIKKDNPELFYGKFVEFGTSKMRARPFLGTAYERNKEQIQEIIAQKLREGLGI
jgi:HK97 gp10 family phage protein